MRLILMILALTLTMPAETEARKKKRNPSNKLPSRAVTFQCKDSPAGLDNMIGVVNMSVKPDDFTVGQFTLSGYVRSGKSFSAKTLSGTYTSVPSGFVLRAHWEGTGSDYVFIHLHPGDRSDVPGFAEKQICQINGQLESI